MAITTKPMLIIPAQLEAVRESLEVIANAVNSDTHRTDEGKAAAWTRDTKPHREYLDKLKKTLEEIGNQLSQAVQSEWDTQLPVAKDDTAKLVVEMEVARILNRGVLKNAGDVVNWAVKQPASPTRTAIIDEFEQRGVLNDALVNQIVRESSPEFTEAQSKNGNFQSRALAVVNMNVRYLEVFLENRRVGHEAWVKADVVSSTDLELAKSVTVPEWSATHTENVYRQNIA